MGKESVFKLGIVLFLICVISTFALSGLNYFTAPIIADVEKKDTQMARTEVLKSAKSFEDINEYLSKGLDGEAVVGYTVNVSPDGFGGKIEMIVGVTKELKVSGVKIVSFSETPGLGSKATEEKFISQFNDKKEGLNVVKSVAKNDNEIVAISGATITSSAVTKGVNEALSIVKKEVGGAK